MSSIERAIMDLEKRIEGDNQALIRATTTGDGKSIAALSISIYNTRKEIDQLFDELDIVAKEHNAKLRQLEERSNGVTSATQ
jgi:predicted  nucleic acid-binding Zn-ribbon protein